MKPLTIFPQPPPLPKKTVPPPFFHETFKPLKETMKKMFQTISMGRLRSKGRKNAARENKKVQWRGYQGCTADLPSGTLFPAGASGNAFASGGGVDMTRLRTIFLSPAST